MLRMISILFLLFIVGCASEERLTKDEWLIRYKPTDANEASAMAILQTKLKEADGKVIIALMMNKFKIACVIGLMGSIIALGIGLWLRMKITVIAGGLGVAACLVGYSLITADLLLGKYLAIGGLAFGLIICGIVIFLVVRALIQTVKGNEVFKTNTSDGVSLKLFKEAQKSKQKPITEGIIDRIRGV